MLILSRHIGEGIIITLEDGSDIVVRILDINPNSHPYSNAKHTKVGIDAPRHLNIAREELFTREIQTPIGAADSSSRKK